MPRLLITPVLILALALSRAISAVPSHKPIELHVPATVCMAPCDVRADVRIEPHPLNRWWIIQIDGPMFVSGMHQLDGEQSAPTQAPVWFKGLPAGEYELVVAVYRNQKTSEAGRDVRKVIVVGEAHEKTRRDPAAGVRP